MAGAQHPGVPGISIGRSENITWGLTAALSDVSDLYREKIDETGTKYFVDNEWKDLKVISHEIKVKNNKTVKFDVKYTHRGPLM